MAPEPYEISIPDRARADLVERLERTRWPAQPEGLGWELGVDIPYLRALCGHWAGAYDWRRLENRLAALENLRWEGIHLIRRRSEGAGMPVMLVHGWPGGPIEFLELIDPLVEAGHDVIVPSLPGYAWSRDPGAPLNVAEVAGRLRALMESALGYERYAVQGGDWGAAISARMAFDSPATVAAVHVNAVSVLPVPGDLAEPPPTDAEREYMATGSRWRSREGHHLYVQSAAPDALAVGLNDSPAGLAAWLVEKYRRWSDCDGEVERRFSKDRLCDLLTMYWATGTIASSMRLYLGERRDRWRFNEDERIGVPAAAADFPGEIVRPPREWAERIFSDLRRWTEMPRGGHFAALEEPELLADDLIGFLDEL
ncbi:MAG: epoxide hydrolase family protein [Solirubrobacterales bacterium]